MEVLIIDYRNYGQRLIKQAEDLVNEAIPFNEVLVIDHEGTSLGIKKRKEALAIATAANLDLVCVAPKANPPVCKLLDYGKYRFESQKKTKEIKKNQKVIETKEVRFTPQTDVHDLEVKAKATKKWLSDGSRVKITVRFRGRQMAHTDIGEATMQRFLEMIEEFATVDKAPALEGRQLYAFIVPKKK